MTQIPLPLEKIQHIHFVGVGGIGVSALARFFHTQGKTISGSDRTDVRNEPDLLPTSMKFFLGHSPSNIEAQVELVVRSSAVPDTNPEIEEAHRRNLPVIIYADALGLIGQTKHTIGVSGTHGKSTTTALLGKFLIDGGKDPTVIVGARVPGWDYNLRKGYSELFVVEACEYERHMLRIAPSTIVLTNIEADHLDYYSGIDDILSAFREYVSALPLDGALIYNYDDPHVRNIARSCTTLKISFGISPDADLVAKSLRTEGNIQSFDLTWKGEHCGRFQTSLPGLYNVSNILAAMAVALLSGVTLDCLKKTLDEFESIGRRFERMGKFGETNIISDYAHHPTALAGASQAVLIQDPNTLIVFQPHQKDRTQKLFMDFVRVLHDIPHLFILEIYEVAGRDQGMNITSQTFIGLLNDDKKRIHPVRYFPSLEACEEVIRTEASKYSTILFIGAGNIHQLARSLVAP